MSDEKLKFLDSTYNLLLYNIKFLQIISYTPASFTVFHFETKIATQTKTYRIGLRTGNPKKT